MSGFAHTGGPLQVKHDWAIEGSTTIIGNVDGEIVDGLWEHTFDFVCRTLDDADDSQSHAVAIANAARIVSAVNAADRAGLTNAALDAGVIGQLVEALEGFVSGKCPECKGWGEVGYFGEMVCCKCNGQYLPAPTHERVARARAALALARGDAA